MSDKVVYQNWPTRLDLPPDRVLEGAKGQVESVVVCGWGKDGEPYFASSISDGPEVLWLLELMKAQLLEVGS